MCTDKRVKLHVNSGHLLYSLVGKETGVHIHVHGCKVYVHVYDTVENYSFSCFPNIINYALLAMLIACPYRHYYRR